MALRSASEDMLPLVVVAHDDAATAESLRHAVEAGGAWRAQVAEPGPAGLRNALLAQPAVAVLGCGVLGDFPDGCRVPLLAVGDDERAADLRAALAAGARAVVSWPDGAAELGTVLARAAAVTGGDAPEQGSGMLVAVRGVHGGAGATTVAAHLAGAWSHWGPAPVLLADLAGGLAFRLDLPAGVRTWSAVAELPEPRDGATLADALAEPWPGMTALPLSGFPDGAAEPPPDPALVRSVLAAARPAYRAVVADLPVAGGPAVEAVLTEADLLVATGRCESAGVRGLEAMLDAWAAAGRDPACAGAAVTCARPGAPLAAREVRVALGERLWATIPAGEELATAAEDGVLLLNRTDLGSVRALIDLAARVAPFDEEAAE